MPSLFLLFALVVCLGGTDAALTKRKQFTVDFSNTYDVQNYECASEITPETFTQAIITLSTATISEPSTFFVTITSASSKATDLCTQYGGGAYTHEGCEKTIQEHSSQSSNGLVVTVPLYHYQHLHEVDLGSITWTVCVGNGRHTDSSTPNSLLHAAGNVLLSTSSVMNPHTQRDSTHKESFLDPPPSNHHKIEKIKKMNVEPTAAAHDSDISVPVMRTSAQGNIDANKRSVKKKFADGKVQVNTAPDDCVSPGAYGDGYCDSDNNVEECNYDGGDCCFEDCTDPSLCFDDLGSYPKECHKDETITVNYMSDYALSSATHDYCGPNYDVDALGANCSLRAAVAFCLGNVVGDNRCIVEIPVGTVELDSSLNEIALMDSGRSLVIRGDGSATTIINSLGGNARFLYMEFSNPSTTEFVLEHVTVSGFGIADGEGGGGAIYSKYLQQGAFNDIIFHDNHAPAGGGMFLESVENVDFNDLAFVANTATADGGGLCVVSEAGMTATYTNMLFEGNVASGGGGGLFINDQDFTLVDSIFNGNNASFGGGFLSRRSGVVASFQNVSFVANAADTHGGGAYLQDMAASVTLINGSFIANTAGVLGGGIFANGYALGDIDFDNSYATYQYDDSLWTVDSGGYGYGGYGGYGGDDDDDNTDAVDLNIVLEGPLFRSNVARDSGGAIYHKSVTTAAFTECSFEGNVAEVNGGALAYHDSHNSTFLRSDFDGNSAGNSGGAVNFSGRLWEIASTYTVTNCNFINNVAMIDGILVDTSSLFSSITGSHFANNTANSGVLLATRSSNYKIENCTFEDNFVNEKGAVKLEEVANVIFQNCQMMSNVGGALYVSEGNDVAVTSSLFVNNSGTDIGAAIALDSEGVGYSIFNCTFIDNAVNLYGGAIASYQDVNLNIDQCTFERNSADVLGGAVFFDGSTSVVVSSCVYRGNTSPQGGAVVVNSLCDQITVNDCDFFSNFADFGGAVLGFNSNQDVNLVNNTFTSNQAVNDGGAVVLATDSVRWIVANNTFRDNSAGNGGALNVATRSESCLIMNNYFVNNTAVNQGGAVSVNNLNNVLRFTSNIFQQNSAKQGGGVFFSTANADVRFDDCTFIENVAVNFGGGITLAQQHSNFVLFNCSFKLNSAITSGGAIYFGFSITESRVEDCLFQENSVSDYGGGAIAMASFNDIDVINGEFYYNSAYYGGAIFTLLKAERFNIVNSTVRQNRATYGGGLYIGAISEEVTLTSVDISLNTVTEGGGGIYVDVASIVSFFSVVFHANAAQFRGGGMYYESNELSLYSSDFTNNSAVDNGGGLFVKGEDITIANGTSFVGNVAHLDGGAFFMENSFDVSVTNVSFVENTALGNGGACGLEESARANLTGVSFLRNKATVSGAALHALQVSDMMVRESEVTSNEAQGAGGGFAIGECTGVLCADSTFKDNVAVGGSAIFTTTSSIVINSNTFTSNRNPTAGGTVFWNQASGMSEPVGLITANTFHLNTALYGSMYATEAVGFTVTTEATLNESESDSYLISDYGTPIVVNAFMHDHYNQLVVSDSSTFLQMSLGDVHSCGDKLPTLSGSTLEQVQNGVSKFESMFGFCNPGGSMEVKVTDVDTTTGLESPAMKWSFRQCLRGEYYRDGECNWCEQGFYSKKDNLDLSVIDCTACPANAAECYADTIVLNKGYWALSVDSEGMTECPMGENACIGGIQSSTGVDDVTGTETTSSGTQQTASFTAQQQAHLLHPRVGVSAFTVADSAFSTLSTSQTQNTSSSNSSGICNTGYTGVLCALCAEDYYYAPGTNTCEACESSGINTFMIVLLSVTGVVLCVPLTLLVLSWTGSSTLDTIITNFSLPALMYMFYMKFVVVKKPGEDETEAERMKREEDINTLFLRIMPKVKIFISMVQITSSMPAVLGMTFPPFFTKVTSIFGLLNLDITTNLGLSCRFKDVDYIDYLIITCLAPIILSVLLCGIYYCHRFILKRRKVAYEVVASVYAKYLLVFLMGTYLGLPNISVQIFQMFSCQNIDPDNASPGDDLYLRADLSIQCGSSRHVTGTTFATCMIFVYPIGVPLMYYWLLNDVKLGILNRNENISPNLRLSIVPTSFLYSSYEPQFWYWEIVETLRRITMTGVIVLIAQGTSLQIVVTMLLALVFIKLYAHFKPFDDDYLDVDAEFAQYQVYFVLFIALLMKEESIPALTNAWGIMLVCVILSLLLLSPMRLFKEKYINDRYPKAKNGDHEGLEALRKREKEAEGDDDSWNEDVGIIESEAEEDITPRSSLVKGNDDPHIDNLQSFTTSEGSQDVELGGKRKEKPDPSPRLRPHSGNSKASSVLPLDDEVEHDYKL